MAQYLKDDSNQAQILVLVMNELGDHQMEVYFNSTDNSGGLVCKGVLGMDTVFDKMNDIHRNSFQDVGGEYSERDENEKTCAMRLPPTVFFKVILRVWHRF